MNQICFVVAAFMACFATTASGVTVGDPTFSPAAGRMAATYTPVAASTLSTAICYTTDGTVPACNANGAACTTGILQATTPIPAQSADATIKAIGCIVSTATTTNSAVATAAYTIPKVVPTPTSSAGAAGAIVNPTDITLTSTGSTGICYSYDGTTTPVCNGAGTGCTAGTIYTAAITTSTANTLQAIGCFDSALTNPDTAAAALSVAYTMAAATTTTAAPAAATTAKPALSGVGAFQPGFLSTLFVILAAALSVY